MAVLYRSKKHEAVEGAAKDNVGHTHERKRALPATEASAPRDDV
jgi:hypothetical protein